MGVVVKTADSYVATQRDVKRAMAGVQNNLLSVIEQLGNISAEALLAIGEDIETRSNELAPKDTGELRESSYVVSAREGNEHTVEIGYTDDKAPYVHENTPSHEDYKNPTTSGTHYKFLQRASTEVEARLAKILAERLKREF